MAEVGEMVIRVRADTSDVQKGLQRTNRDLQQMQMQAARSQRNAARLQTGAAVASLAATGYGAYRATRALRRPARAIGGRALRAGATAVAGRTALGGLASVLGGPITMIIAGVAATALAAKTLVGLARKQNDLLQEQVRELSALGTAAIRQQRTIGEELAFRAAAQDPYARGVQFASQRLAQRRTGATPLQVAAGLEMHRSTQELQEARDAYKRIFVPFTAGLRTLWNDMKASGYRGGVNVATGAGKLNRRLQRNEQEQSLFTRLATRLGISGISPAAGGLMYGRDFYNWITGRSQQQARQGVAAGVTAQQQAAMRRLQMEQLQFMGPGNILTPSPTIQAGSEQEYYFRVQQQLRGVQTEVWKAWRERVVILLEQMVEEGEASRAELESARLRSGESVEQIVGVN